MSNPQKSIVDEEFLNDISSIRQSSVISQEKLSEYESLIQIKDKYIQNLEQKNRIITQQLQPLKKIVQYNETVIKTLQLRCTQNQNETINKYMELVKLEAKITELSSQNKTLKETNLKLQSLFKSKEESQIDLRFASSIELQEQKKIQAILSRKVKELEARIENMDLSSVKELQTDSDLEMELKNKLDIFAQEMNNLKKSYDEEIKRLQKELDFVKKSRNNLQKKYSTLKSQNQLLKRQSQIGQSELRKSSLRKTKFIDIDSDQMDQHQSVRCTSSQRYIIMELEEQLDVLRNKQKLTFLNLISTWSEQKFDLEFQEIAIL